MSEVRDKPTASAEAQLDKTQGLKLLVELGPLVLFFLVNWQAGKHLSDPKQAIFWATGSFMAATVAALGASKYLFRKVAVMPLVTGVFVMVFGGLTIYLQDEQFIKMKPTIVNGLFAAVLLGGLLFGKALLGYVFDSAFKLDAEGWRKLTLRWGLFFIFLAVLNEVVWRNFSTDFWVAFKVWGTMPITLAFTLSQMPLIIRHSEEKASSE